MDWKFNGSQPVYQQIMDKLRLAVLSGELASGEKVPSVRELASEANVNPNTMQRALSHLEQEGLLVGAGTLGRTVTREAETLAALRERMVRQAVAEFREKLKNMGVSVQEATEWMREE